MQKDIDEKYMSIALTLARRGAGFVNPNPMVGAVIVAQDRIIGRGYHEAYGGPHAEVNAFLDAEKRGEATKGATLYVTLEPCFHYGKTPPCVDLVLKKEVARVVIGSMDPNPLVAGKSIEKMKKAGICVVTDVLLEECLKLNEAFFLYVTTKKPFVLLKSALSLDGKIAAAKGESRWISCEESRREVHEMRGQYQSIMVGIGTVLADDPSLTCRIAGRKSPIRIVVDSTLKLPLTAKILQNQEIAKTIIATTNRAEARKKSELEKMGIQVLVCSQNKEVDWQDSKYKSITALDTCGEGSGLSEPGAGRVNLTELIEKIGEMKIDSILLEGGAELAFEAVRENLVDKVRYYLAPILIGGKHSKTALGGAGFAYLKDALVLERVRVRQIGRDICVEGYRAKKVGEKCLQEL